MEFKPVALGPKLLGFNVQVRSCLIQLHKCIGNCNLILALMEWWPFYRGGLSIEVAAKTGHGFHSLS